MNKKALRKDFYIEIKNTFSRFMSIFLIVALGVAFFSGIRSTEPAMKLSADQFFDDCNLMDIRILSSMGLTEGDVEALTKVKGVKEVEGAYTADLLYVNEESQKVLKIFSYPNNLNQVTVLDGRAPSAANECFADEAFLKKAGLKIGDKITLKSGDDKALEDVIKDNEYEITGSGTSPLYLSRNKGSSSIGNGTADGFLYLSEDAFALDVFTVIYVSVNDAMSQNSYGEEYEDLVDNVIDRIEDDVQDARVELRYNEVRGEAEEELEEAKQELGEEEKKAEDEFAKAEKELKDAKTEISNGEKEIQDNEKKLLDGRKELESKEKELKDGKAALTTGKTELIKNENSYNEGKEAFEVGLTEYNENEQVWKQGTSELQKQKELLQYIEDPAELAAAQAMVDETQKQLDGAEKSLIQAKGQIDATRKQLENANNQIQNAKKQLADSEEEITKGEKALTSAKKELDKGEKELADAKVQISDAKNDYEEGEAEYRNEKEDALKKIADAKEEIEDAQEEIEKIKYPEWYVLDRGSIQANVEFGSDAEKIGAIGKVFPVIFFLVAALVSLTTMTRMVEEQRTQIGTLKALGYGKGSIASKYLLYALLASVGGSIFGGILGGKLLPYVIITAYKTIYENLGVIVTPIFPEHFITASLLAVACVCAATLFSCYKELTTSPAELMRPASPKLGKRVFMEKIPFIWKRLNFTGKATIRNLIRYKKRFFMTVFGISGCMALMLVGFGIRDSLLDVVGLQFEELRLYDGIAGLDQDARKKEIKAAVEYIENHEKIAESSKLYETSVDASADDIEKSAQLSVLEQTAQAGDYYVFRNRTTKEAYVLNDSSVLVTEKLTNLLDVKTGDTIYLKDEDNKKIPVTIGGIVENYVMHYIFMTPVLYEALYDEKPDYNEIIYLTNDLSVNEEGDFSKQLLEQKGIVSNAFTRQAGSDFEESMGNLDVVILILILSAGSLAFIVLYNLNNINITERKRELATIKVLGFYDMELSEYVFRENILLTAIGIAAGILFGIILHRYVILTAEIDLVMFSRKISTLSFLKSTLWTILFSVIVNVSMHFKLKKIDMATSLKSVE